MRRAGGSGCRCYWPVKGPCHRCFDPRTPAPLPTAIALRYPLVMSEWRSCSSCKKSIAHRARYWVCSVSTCNRPRSNYAFCSVQCWDAHVPVMNHRNAWAEERRAPAETVAETHGAQPAAAEGPRRRIARKAEPRTRNEEDDEILIIASRLKAYINRKGGGMNTSADVLPALSDLVREAALEAIDAARADGRKTVKGRDIPTRR